jgi:hypothetical protein
MAGSNHQVNRRKTRIAPVDAITMRESEAGTASEAGAWLSFWCWYLPSEEFRLGRRLRGMLRVVTRGAALLRYPLYRASVRGVAAKAPLHR